MERGLALKCANSAVVSQLGGALVACDWKTTRTWVGGLATAAIIGSVIYGFCRGLWVGFDPQKPTKVHQAYVLGLWILLPPIWFWLEYFFLYKDEGTAVVKLEAFKHGQEQSAKIWLALVTLLAGLYFGKDLVREAPSPSTTPPSSEAHGISGNPDL